MTSRVASRPAPRAAARRHGNAGWSAAGLLATLIVALPIVAVAWIAFTPAENIWPHLVSTILPRELKNTGLLMAGNAVGVVVLGVGPAWLVAQCRFPGRGVFAWALMLPLAMPAYISAFVYTDLLDFAGPLQQALRAAFGWRTARDYWFPDIRTLPGAVFVMSFALYPYVYLLARAAFAEQSARLIEASRTLGRGPWRSFLTVALPVARPAIAVGVTVALMETLSDFGTVDFFAINTLTMGVFNVWLHMGNAAGAAQISLVMLAVLASLIAAERLARRRQRSSAGAMAPARPPAPFMLRGARAWAAAAACAAPVLVGFLVPALTLARLATLIAGDPATAKFIGLATNSLILSGSAAVLALAVALLLAYAVRLRGSPVIRVAARLASLGYAVPGAVLAIGVLIPFAAFDNGLDSAMRKVFGVSTGLILSGSLFALLYAYLARFLAVAYGTIEAGMGRIAPTLDMAARSLGAGPGRTLARVHAPLLRNSALVAALLVFVDSMKELPATLILRPFNFETLATHTFQFASDELLKQASPAALAIVLAGVVPVILLTRGIGHAPEPMATHAADEAAIGPANLAR